MKRLAIGVLALAISVAPQKASPAEPYEINAILAATGQESFLGREQVRTLEIIEALINKGGGLDGRPIKFVIFDDQSNPQTAVQLASGIVAKKAPVIIGSSSVALCNAMSPLTKDGPTLYCLSPGIHPPDGSYVFSSGISTADTLGTGIRYLGDRGWKRVAVITSTDATGQDADRIVDATIAAQPGMSIVSREHFNTTDVTVAAQMAHVKASGAQALIAWSTGSAFGTLMRGATDAGVNMPVLTSAGNMTYAQMREYAPFLPKDLYFPGSPPYALAELRNGPVKRAVNAFIDAMTAAGIKPENGHILAWDATLILMDALKKLGTNADAAQIRDYIENARGVAGILGLHDFRRNPQRGVGASSVVMVRWDSAKETWIGVK